MLNPNMSAEQLQLKLSCVIAVSIQGKEKSGLSAVQDYTVYLIQIFPANHCQFVFLYIQNLKK